MPFQKYRPFHPLTPGLHRTWPDHLLDRAPTWCSVDLRDGNQALIDPMDVVRKLVLFTTFVEIQFKEIEHENMDERILHIQNCMYQYSRAIYRSIKDLIDPYVDPETQLVYRREVLAACEGTMERLAASSKPLMRNFR